MGRSGDGAGRRFRRRAPHKLAVVPHDEGERGVALARVGRARTTRGDTWGLPPPGPTSPHWREPLDSHAEGELESRQRQERASAPRVRVVVRAPARRWTEAAQRLAIGAPYERPEIHGDRGEMTRLEKNVLILGAPRSKVRLPSTPGGNAGPKKGAPKEETS